jgi:hypothetical protein
MMKGLLELGVDINGVDDTKYGAQMPTLHYTMCSMDMSRDLNIC